MGGDIEQLAKRAMNLQANISDGELTLIDEECSVVIREKSWMTLLVHRLDGNAYTRLYHSRNLFANLIYIWIIIGNDGN